MNCFAQLNRLNVDCWLPLKRFTLALTLKIRWKHNKKLIASMDLVFASVCLMFESGLLYSILLFN